MARRPTRRDTLAGLGALAGGLALGPGPGRALVATDLSLVLAVDCSWSVDADEYVQQMLGIAVALRDAQVVDAITSGPTGRISVCLVQWSADSSQVLVIPWTLVDGGGAATSLADRIAATPRQTAEGGTAISSAISFATRLFEIDPNPGTRRVIDVSGDGRNNTRQRIGGPRANALARGVTINGLPILNEDATLDYYFRNVLIGGPNAFVEIATDYTAYAEAIRRKLLREIRYTGYS